MEKFNIGGVEKISYSGTKVIDSEKYHISGVHLARLGTSLETRNLTD